MAISAVDVVADTDADADAVREFRANTSVFLWSKRRVNKKPKKKTRSKQVRGGDDATLGGIGICEMKQKRCNEGYDER